MNEDVLGILVDIFISDKFYDLKLELMQDKKELQYIVLDLSRKDVCEGEDRDEYELEDPLRLDFYPIDSFKRAKEIATTFKKGFIRSGHKCELIIDEGLNPSRFHRWTEKEIAEATVYATHKILIYRGSGNRYGLYSYPGAETVEFKVRVDLERGLGHYYDGYKVCSQKIKAEYNDIVFQAIAIARGQYMPKKDMSIPQFIRDRYL